MILTGTVRVLLQSDSIGEEGGVGDQIGSFLAVEGGVAEIDTNYRAFEAGHGNVIAAPERTIEQDENSRQEVGERIAKSEPKREAGEAQSSYERGNIHAKRAESRHAAEDEQAYLCDLADQIENVLPCRI